MKKREGEGKQHFQLTSSYLVVLSVIAELSQSGRAVRDENPSEGTEAESESDVARYQPVEGGQTPSDHIVAVPVEMIQERLIERQVLGVGPGFEQVQIKSVLPQGAIHDKVVTDGEPQNIKEIVFCLEMRNRHNNLPSK